ncbi:hypothetical protein TSA1_08460 [Bradyrhizobium nitroreducens]|uniref:Uncharacterized protein n=1 Tax=Bradyrhizobium nitroreducens TaxID=709803 RepID=A0A2M6U897_9BRAD|nr:hypothetical protein TSA1_08460 [Bradyrhizobium nitroreducens]
MLAQATGVAAEAKAFATEPGSVAKSAGMSHAAEMRAAAKARVSAAEAATTKPAVAAATAMCLSRSNRQR